MNFGGESVGVVAEGVFDSTEDLFGWRVGESLGHLAYALFQEWLEPLRELPDAGLAVFEQCRSGRAGVCHDQFTVRRDLLHPE